MSLETSKSQNIKPKLLDISNFNTLINIIQDQLLNKEIELIIHIKDSLYKKIYKLFI